MVLLHRSTREVRLPPPGAVFLEQCRGLVGASATAETAAKQAADGQAGELRIGAVTSAFSDPLPSALSLFRHDYPRVEITVEEVDTHVAVQALRRRELDVALVRKLATPPDCERVTLRSEQFVLAVPGEWEGSAQVPRDLAAAATLPWIWLPRHISPDYHDQVAACCRAAGFAPETRHTAHSITSQLAMVACGLGIALVPESAAPRPGSSDHGSTRFVRLDRTPTIDLAAVWRRDTTTLIDGFLASVRTAIGH